MGVYIPVGLLWVAFLSVVPTRVECSAPTQARIMIFTDPVAEPPLSQCPISGMIISSFFFTPNRKNLSATPRSERGEV